jgi:hypothetical protein
MVKKAEEKRPTLLEENIVLKETIKALQDENGNIFAAYHELDKRVAVFDERLSEFGFRDFCKNVGFIGIGTSISEGINGQFQLAFFVALGSCILLLFFSIYDNIQMMKRNKKEKV